MDDNSDDGSPLQIPKKRSRMKVLKDWHQEAITKLIASVKAEELLWNTENDHYKTRSMRDMAWNRISKNCFGGDYDAEQLNAKWSNLRIQFKQYYFKVKNEKNMKITWRYYKPMLFLLSVKARLSRNNASQSNSSRTKIREEIPPEPKETPCPNNNKGMKVSVSSVDDIKLITLQGIEQTLKKTNDVDSFQIFANYIAEELRKIPNQQIANKIQRKLTRTLMDCLDEMEDPNINSTLVIIKEENMN